MRNIWNSIALLSLCAFLSACETFPVAEQKSFAVEKGKSVILVGLVSQERAILFNEENANGPHWLRHLNRPERQKRDVDVYAFPHPTGKSFKIVRVATLGNGPREARFTTAPSLTPDKDGIYYYGTMTVSYVMVSINDTEKAQLLKLAKEKYRNVFEALAPINFR